MGEAMTATRLSALDASFLEVESPTAHMHVGWVASFSPPEGQPAPTYRQLHKHLESRLCRAPRYRQRLAEVPLSLHEPLWVDDEDFDCSRHLHQARTSDLDALADSVLSVPLRRDRPLWEMWIAPHLPDRRIGLVGKAHHCLVDGIAAVELASLLLDLTVEPPAPEPDGWRPQPSPGPVERLAGAARDRLGEQMGLMSAPVRMAGSPRRLRAHRQEGASHDRRPGLGDGARHPRPRPQPADLGRPPPGPHAVRVRGPAAHPGALPDHGQRRAAGGVRRRRAPAAGTARRAGASAEDDGAR